MMNFKDKQLTCNDCKKPFVFTEGEQEFYTKMEFHDPSRCPKCRTKRRQARQNNRAKKQTKALPL